MWLGVGGESTGLLVGVFVRPFGSGGAGDRALFGSSGEGILGTEARRRRRRWETMMTEETGRDERLCVCHLSRFCSGSGCFNKGWLLFIQAGKRSCGRRRCRERLVVLVGEKDRERYREKDREELLASKNAGGRYVWESGFGLVIVTCKDAGVLPVGGDAIVTALRNLFRRVSHATAALKPR